MVLGAATDARKLGHRAMRAARRAVGALRMSVWELFCVMSALAVLLQSLQAIEAPRWVSWPMALATFGCLLLVLPWWRERVQLHTAAARRRAAEAASVKRMMAKKCCRNCDTVFANQAPGGSRPEFKCVNCGLASRKPKLLIPGEPTDNGESSGERAATASDGKAAVGTKPADKKSREEPQRATCKARSRPPPPGPKDSCQVHASKQLLAGRRPKSRNASKRPRRRPSSGNLRRRRGPVPAACDIY